MSNLKLQTTLDQWSYVKKDRLKPANSDMDPSSDTDSPKSDAVNGTKPKMVSLLKMPPAASGAASEDTQTDSEKLWYLKELFPSLQELDIMRVMDKCSSMDQAESELTKLSCDRAIKKSKPTLTQPLKRSRVRIMSDSSEDDPRSPVKTDLHLHKKSRVLITTPSPSSSQESNPLANGSADGRGTVTVQLGGKPVTISYSENSQNGHQFDQSVRRTVTNGYSASSTGHKKRRSTESQKLVQLSSDYKEDKEEYVSSDEEVVKSKSKRGMILQFFNTAGLDEILHMPRCKEKKAELIISLRPYKDWKDITEKFSAQRTLGTDALENCKELIEIRQVVLDLMGQCEKMSETMSTHVNTLLTNDLQQCTIKQQPSLINTELTLKSYQMIGINWLHLMYEHKMDGILADEMGLGKTSQSIAFLAYLLEHGNKGPHLIIVPSSTLDNWATELQRWCPSLKVLIYHGSGEDRQYLRQQIFYEKESYHIILSTYNVLTSTVDDKQIYKKIMFQYTVLDEAHLLKNMMSLRYKNLSKIQSVRRLLLTGTPFQNDLVELMSLLCFVMPNLFTNKEAELKKMFQSISKTDVNGSSFQAQRISHAKNIMKPFVLRRLKKDVLSEMPHKILEVKHVELSPAQSDIYSSLASALCKDDVQLGKMSALTDLRFTANHHLLLRRRYTNDKLRSIASDLLNEPSHADCNEQFVFEDMQVMSDYEIHNLCKTYKSIKKYSLTDKDILSSGKFKYLDQLLPQIKAKGEKVLIFTQFKLVLDILQNYLKLRDHSYLRLDGSTPVSERLSMIDEFNADPDLFVFILSTRAGGLGINLTSANHVIVHDIDWNPHNDRQAEDRCHRLGQEKEVHVYRLISKDTVEAAMLAQADRKLELEKQIQRGNNKEETVDVNMLKETLSRWTTNH